MSVSSQEKQSFRLNFISSSGDSPGKSSVKLLYKLNVMRFHGLEAFWIFMHPDCDVVSNYDIIVV